MVVMMKEEEHKGIAVLLVLIAISSIFIFKVYKTIQELEKTYEYSKNGEIHESNKCYLKNDVTYCEKDDIAIMVDYYYTIK